MPDGFLAPLRESYETYLTTALDTWLNANYPEVAAGKHAMFRVIAVDNANKRTIASLRDELARARQGSSHG